MMESVNKLAVLRVALIISSMNITAIEPVKDLAEPNNNTIHSRAFVHSKDYYEYKNVENENNQDISKNLHTYIEKFSVEKRGNFMKNPRKSNNIFVEESSFGRNSGYSRSSRETAGISNRMLESLIVRRIRRAIADTVVVGENLAKEYCNTEGRKKTCVDYTGKMSIYWISEKPRYPHTKIRHSNHKHRRRYHGKNS